MKKAVAITLALVMVLALCACGSSGKTEAPAAPAVDDLKVGFIFILDENSTYDRNFMNAADAACEKLGLNKEQFIYRKNVPEGQEAYEAAAELVDAGCSLVFANSFGHEDFIIQAAKEFPNVQFCHATGNKAHTEGLSNFHNAFAPVYQARYLAGIAGGLKLNEMIEKGEIKPEEAKIGYVGAFTYAEIISGYTAFFLGARSVCPSATMEVTFTGSWGDESAEKEGANKLIARGCKLISQHANTMGAPTACETAGVPNIAYNLSNTTACPNTFIVASLIDWTPYFEYIISQVIAGQPIDTDWVGSLALGSADITEVNVAAAAPNTVESLETAKKAIIDGQLEVFDTATFTVDGKPVTSYKADVDVDPNYEPDTEVIENGIFYESKFRAAPYFDLQIDGITLLDTVF